ncbi:competence/damage-inducible protein A [Bacillaceae bacterium W0354]
MIEHSKCEIITVGTELLLGQVLDTNSTWLSEKLAHVGINVFHKQTVGDNYDRLLAVFKEAQKRSNIVIVTGGLGPTEDDLTRQVAADLFGCELEVDQQTLDKIEAFFKERKLNMPENNRKQALSFSGGKVFANKVGMAPGLYYKNNDTLWFFLPGVPKEMKWIVEEQIFPFLSQEGFLKKQLSSRVLTFQGIGESLLEAKLYDYIQEQTNPTIAPLAGNGYVTIRITAQGESKEEANQLIDPVEKKILERVGNYFVGYGNIPLEVQVMENLKMNQLTLSSCESITGGLFASTIIQHDGASNVFNGSIVSYSNKVKEHVVGVPKSVLANEGAVSELTAKIMAENIREKFNSDVSISFTGVAGKDPVEGYSQGTVFIGLSFLNHETVVKKVNLFGTRNAIREEAVLEGLKFILAQINPQK